MVEVTLAADSPPILRQVADLSHGGVFVDSPTPLPEGTAVRLRFTLPGESMPMTLEAQVAWTQPHVGMGLRFTKLRPAEKRAIDRFVDETIRGREDRPTGER